MDDKQYNKKITDRQRPWVLHFSGLSRLSLMLVPIIFGTATSVPYAHAQAAGGAGPLSSDPQSPEPTPEAVAALPPVATSSDGCAYLLAASAGTGTVVSTWSDALTPLAELSSIDRGVTPLAGALRETGPAGADLVIWALDGTTPVRVASSVFLRHLAAGEKARSTCWRVTRTTADSLCSGGGWEIDLREAAVSQAATSTIFSLDISSAQVQTSRTCEETARGFPPP